MNSRRERAIDSYDHGQAFPYDSPDSGNTPRMAKDWAHQAARGILSDLTDRRGVKNGFSRIDYETRLEIVDAVAEIIRVSIDHRRE